MILISKKDSKETTNVSENSRSKAARKPVKFNKFTGKVMVQC